MFLSRYGFQICIIIAIIFSPFKIQSDNTLIFPVNFGLAQSQFGIPAGWELVKIKGTPHIRIERGVHQTFLHMASGSGSSFGIKKEISVDDRINPFLNWEWKAAVLPMGGDVRDKNKDDQAAQIYAAFSSSEFLSILNYRLVGLYWGNRRLGWSGPGHRRRDRIRYIVLRDKLDKRSTWVSEKRNVLADYEALFKEPIGNKKIIGISLFINSHHTKSYAESYFRNIYFSSN